MRFWKKNTNNSKGTVTTTEPAMMVPHGISKAVVPAIKEIATGTVRSVSLITKVSANKNSFHAPMKASKPVETRAGHNRGMKT